MQDDVLGFNPRAREGRDARWLSPSLRNYCFNPRAREGRDSGLMWEYIRAIRVSTHAPARGATIIPLSPWCLCGVSTHAPARGATRRRVRVMPLLACFNPRAREGRDERIQYHY